MIITNAKGRQFLVRIVFQGDKYGLRDVLTHDKPEPMIEFYDWTYANPGPVETPIESTKFGARGQFVSRYTAGVLAYHTPGVGLDLFGGELEWKIDAEAFAPVIATAKALLRDFDAPASRWSPWTPKEKKS